LNKKHQIILGLDPGTVIMGYGLISIRGNTAHLVEMGVLKLSTKEDHSERLGAIFKKVDALIRLHQPDSVAIEAPFYGKNVQSMLKLGRAQGVAIAAAMANGLPTTEFAPKKIKQSITCRGTSTKEQVWAMLQHILNFKEDIAYLDASDALAVAICHFYQHNAIISENKLISKPKVKKSNKWDDFITQNPGRVQ